jgi:hypothetical protein
MNNIKEFNPKAFDATKKIILFGAGNIGILAFEALKQNNINVSFYYDNDTLKQDKNFNNTVVLSKKNFCKLNNNSIVIICNNYIQSTLDFLNENNFTDIFDCTKLLRDSKFDINYLLKIQEKQEITFQNLKPLSDYKRIIELHSNTFHKKKDMQSFSVKYLDVVVTERCSMKCIDCSNLMQYYKNAKNSDLNQLLFSLDRFMKIVDQVYEFRVIGGEPFVNQELYKILEVAVNYNNLENVIIYTNAQHIPNDRTLHVLKNKKIKLDITNYKSVGRSKKHDELIKTLIENKINYITHEANLWTDSGRIKFRNKSNEELKNMFKNCCVNDVLTLLNGFIYRCPFSANANNLSAIPREDRDIVEISNKRLDDVLIKKELISLYTRKDKEDFLAACNYCGGRDYSTPSIKAAIQTKLPILF